MQIKILSWNIWFGTHYKEIINHLKVAQADIIGLQEVREEYDGKHNTAENIAKELGYHWKYEHASEMRFENRLVSWGNAILSKYPITDSKLHVISEEKDRRTALEAGITIEGKTVHVLSTHLVHTHQKFSELQLAQAEKLLSIMPKEKALVMGDFNAIPESETIRQITTSLQHTDTQLDPTWSVYPQGCEVCKVRELLYRLDYIFATKDIHVQSFQTDYSKGSDHLPIATTIEL